MEPSGCNHSQWWQIRSPRNVLKQAKTVVVGCQSWLPRLHDKEEVDGSSPSEGLLNKSKGEAKTRSW
jgi:hypothetical protein